ncbi:MAG: phage holin family protein [Gemmataceae bacterium]
MTRLVGAIIDDATKLIAQHVEMFRAEVRQDFHRTLAAFKYLSLGLLLALAGCLFLAVGLVLLMATMLPTLPAWSCWLIVGGSLLILGGIALVIGKMILRSIQPLPQQTLAALQENVSWITKART